MNISQFILAGHSFGGYVCGMYATKYPYHVKKLLMLSPLGIPKIVENFDVGKAFKENKNPTVRKPSRCTIRVARCGYNNKCSPFGIMRCSGSCCANRLLKSFVNRRFASLPPNERELYKQYLHQTLLMGGSTEYAIFVCFNMYMFPKHALVEEDRLGGIKIPVSFFYGQYDWMSKDGC
mmetsp:Transcript_17661/g.16902  ORF Transcript_17661/g.16902 Transcript_17661/m.16902 type:complete len:178 (+) Transcript_17661:376-909(+)